MANLTDPKIFENITKPTRYRASYVKRDFTVRWLDGSSVLKTETVGMHMSATPPPNPTKAGYTFVRWDKDYSSITTDTDIQAVFEIVTHTVRWLNWNDSLIKEEKVQHGSAATPPTEPIRDGYTFSKWDKSYAQITASVDIKAVFIPNVSINTATVHMASHYTMGWLKEVKSDTLYISTLPFECASYYDENGVYKAPDKNPTSCYYNGDECIIQLKDQYNNIIDPKNYSIEVSDTVNLSVSGNVIKSKPEIHILRQNTISGSVLDSVPSTTTSTVKIKDITGVVVKTLTLKRTPAYGQMYYGGYAAGIRTSTLVISNILGLITREYGVSPYFNLSKKAMDEIKLDNSKFEFKLLSCNYTSHTESMNYDNIKVVGEEAGIPEHRFTINHSDTGASNVSISTRFTLMGVNKTLNFTIPNL